MSKSSKIIITLLIILIIAVLGIGGYLIISQNNKENKSSNVSTEIMANNVVNTVEDNQSNSENIVQTNTNSNTSTSTTILTSSELKEIETYFNKRENNGFVLPYNTYTKPSEINLGTVFYDVFILEQGNKSLENEELNEYKSEGGPAETDIRKVTTKQAEEFYLEKTGEKLTNVNSRLEWIYLEKYDAYYAEGGDTAFIEVSCTSGVKTSDGKYVLNVYAENGYNTVTLKKNGNNYIFISNETGANNN